MKRNELKRKLGITAAAGVLCLGILGAGMAVSAQETEEVPVETEIVSVETEAADAEAAGETESISENADAEAAAGESDDETGTSGESEISIEYASMFDIEYLENNVKLITDGDGNQRLLVPRDGEIPEGYEDVVVIRTPVERVLYCSATEVSSLEAIGGSELYDSVVGVSAPVEDWTIPEIIEGMENGTIAYVVQNDQTAANVEDVADLAPDLVMMSGGQPGAATLGTQLDEVGIPYIIDSGWMEETNEGYMEWLKLFGALYNMDQEAADVFEAKLARIDELKNMTAQIPEEERPVVAIGSFYDGVVYTQGSESSTAERIAEAGGVYALNDLAGDGSMQISMEEFLDKAKDADIMIYTSVITYSPDKAYLEAQEPLVTEFKAFQDDNIFVYAKDYYMSGADADEKFEDLVAIVHPELMEGYEMQHMVRLPDTAE